MDIEESYSLSANKYCSVVGKRVFVPVVALERTSLLPKIEKRLADIEVDLGTTSKDSLEFKLPAGYKIEALPPDVSLSTDFGRYTLCCKVDKQTLHITRCIEVKEGKFPASKYNEMYDFYKKMSAADNSKAILIKEEN